VTQVLQLVSYPSKSCGMLTSLDLMIVLLDRMM